MLIANQTTNTRENPYPQPSNVYHINGKPSLPTQMAVDQQANSCYPPVLEGSV
jgi:hypothetical protein